MEFFQILSVGYVQGDISALLIGLKVNERNL